MMSRLEFLAMLPLFLGLQLFWPKPKPIETPLAAPSGVIAIITGEGSVTLAWEMNK